jgi:hypothetical protein
VCAYNLCDVCTFTERLDIVLLVTKAARLLAIPSAQYDLTTF